MSKSKSKITTRASYSRTKPFRSTAPLGLRTIIAALAEADTTGRMPAIYAEQLQHAPAIILDAIQEERSMFEALSEIINQHYPGNNFGPNEDAPASTCADHSMDVAYWVGVATCWHIMTAINSRDGAR